MNENTCSVNEGF